MNCLELSEDRLSTISEKMQRIFDIAAFKAPSIVIFDDFEILCPAEQEVSFNANR